VETNSSQVIAVLEYLVAFACLGWVMFMLKRHMRRTGVVPTPDPTTLTFSEKVTRLKLRADAPPPLSRADCVSAKVASL